MENVYYNAYTEIYEILSYMPIDYIKKLSKELLLLFEHKKCWGLLNGGVL